MKQKYNLRHSLLLGASTSLLAISSASAADGTWNVNASGNWSTTTNWLSGIVADVSGSTANFSNLITANRIVTLDSDRTLTGLVFGDPFTPYTASAGNWTLSGSGKLTLAGTTPGITVHNLGTGNVATISSVIEGSAGLVKNGAGFLTLNGSEVNTFTGGLTVNAGTLRLAYGPLATPTDLVNSGNALTVGGGALQINAKGTATTNQTFNGVTVAAGGGSILSTNNSAANVTNINLGALTTSASGGSLLVGTSLSAGTAGLTITTTTNKDAQGIYGGRMVFWNGTANTGYDWATTTSSGSPYTLSGLGTYSPLALTAGTNTDNSSLTASATLSGSRTTNSLKIVNTAGSGTQTLALGGNTLTLASGGLLSTGTRAYTISGTAGATRLTAGADSNYELIIHQYNSGGLTISAVIGDNGMNAVSLVKAGTGTLNLLGANTGLSGKIYLNAGRLSAGGATANVARGTEFGTGEIDVTSGAFIRFFNVSNTSTVAYANDLTLRGNGNGTGALQNDGNATANHIIWNGTITLAADAQINAQNLGRYTFNGDINQSGGSRTLSLAVNGGPHAINAGLTMGTVNHTGSGAVNFGAASVIDVGTWSGAGAGALNFSNGSIYSWDVNNTGTSYDKVIATSLVDGDTAGGSTFRLVVADSTFANAFWNTNQTWADIFTTNGTTAISDWASIFTASVVNSSFDPLDTSAKGTFSISGSTLTWTAVPEPTSALAGLLLGAGLLRRRRSGSSAQVPQMP